MTTVVKQSRQQSCEHLDLDQHCVKAAKPKSMMGEQYNNEIPYKLFQKIGQYTWLGQKHSTAIEREIQNWSTIKNLNGKFHYKSITNMPVKKYKSFVENVGIRFNLDRKVKDSMLDALICRENEENFKSFKFIDDKGYIYYGWYLTEKKDDTIDVAYAIYTANFELVETERLVLNWWYVFPTGWTYRKELQMPTLQQKNKLEEWCKFKFFNEVKTKIH